MFRLKGVNTISESLLCEQLQANMVAMFDWGFVNVGGFANVTRPTSGVYGGNFARLRVVEDPYYTKGQIWETARSNWVWESGYGIQISGVYVNSSFLPLNSGYSLNYPLGRITFDTAISSTALVEMNYSYKKINVYNAQTETFKELMFDSYRIDDSHFLQYGSGVWSTLARNRVQMPAVLVEAVPRRRFTGYQHGGGHLVFQDVLFYIFAETNSDRNRILDMITYQIDKKFMTFDLNSMISSTGYPIDLRTGSLLDGSRNFDYLTENFGWRTSRFSAMTSQEITANTPGLYMGVARATVEVTLPEI